MTLSLITGGAGFIGSNLADQLLARVTEFALLIMNILTHMINSIGMRIPIM